MVKSDPGEGRISNQAGGAQEAAADEARLKGSVADCRALRRSLVDRLHPALVDSWRCRCVPPPPPRTHDVLLVPVCCVVVLLVPVCCGLLPRAGRRSLRLLGSLLHVYQWLLIPRRRSYSLYCNGLE